MVFDCYGIVFWCLVVNGYVVRCINFVVVYVFFFNGVFFVVDGYEVFFLECFEDIVGDVFEWFFCNKW